MELQKLRTEIDEIDDQLIRLFAKRMSVSAAIGAYKKENHLPFFVPAREREKLADAAKKAGPELAEDTRVLYATLMSLSRGYQSKLHTAHTALYRNIHLAIENTAKLFPSSPMVACQGVEGAFSQVACEKMIKNPNIMYFKNFEAVFTAIEQGLCQYGVLPIENSTAGSVNKIYDLMLHHRFSIVRTTRLKINHNLLANAGATIDSIREIYSHEQAISQCGNFLSQLQNVKIIPVENTAIAAEFVAKSKRKDIAAIAGRNCAQIYGLENLVSSIHDEGNNHTRFICISKKLEIYPGADKTSIMMTLHHQPGALYNVLSRLYTLGINVTKLESRPLPDRDFEFMFYFDLDTSIYSEEFVQLICELEELCESFTYLGSYSEVT